MSTIWKGSTNGGANRFFTKDGELMVAGQGVGGRQKADLDLVADIWGATMVRDNLSDLTGPIAPGQIKVSQVSKEVKGLSEADLDALIASDPNVIRRDDGKVVELTDAYQVTIGGKNAAGNISFRFEGWYKDVNTKKLEGTGKFEGKGLLDNSGITTDGEVSSKAEGAAMNFALFLEDMLETDAIKLIEDAGAKVDIGNQEPGGDEIRNLDKAIGNTFNSNDIKDDLSVKFSGAGVGGSTSTDPFSSKAAAQNFIDTVKNVGENGFLDDILLS